MLRVLNQIRIAKCTLGRMLSFSDRLAIVLCILGSILGFVIGWIAPKVHQWVRTRLTRKFWRKFSRIKQAKVIVGVHRRFESWDPAGLAGVGDVRALNELQAIFVESGLGRLPSIVSSDPESALPQGSDLILIGGPDVNAATKEVARRRPGRFTRSDVENDVSITDQETGEVYPKRIGHGIRADAGVIKRMPNPLDKARQVLIIAGSFGHGTLAGAKLCRDKDFLKDRIVASGGPFECLFTTEVVADEPVRTEVVAIAALKENSITGRG
jgi:hypothetical protein